MNTANLNGGISEANGTFLFDALLSADFVARTYSAPATGLVIHVALADFYFDLNGPDPGSGAEDGGVWDGGVWDGSAQWSSDPDGESGVFEWVDGANAVFAAGEDAAGQYTITLDGARNPAPSFSPPPIFELHVEFSDDLVHWPEESRLAVGGNTATSDPGVLVEPHDDFDEIRFVLPEDAIRRFARLRVMFP